MPGSFWIAYLGWLISSALSQSWILGKESFFQSSDTSLLCHPPQTPDKEQGDSFIQSFKCPRENFPRLSPLNAPQLCQSPCAPSAVTHSPVPDVRLKLSSHTMTKFHLFTSWQGPGCALPGRVSTAGWGMGKGRQSHKKGQHHTWWERQSLLFAICTPWQASKAAHEADTELSWFGDWHLKWTRTDFRSL